MYYQHKNTLFNDDFDQMDHIFYRNFGTFFGFLKHFQKYVNVDMYALGKLKLIWHHTDFKNIFRV